MKPLKLHPEFGLNPTIALCFFCQEEKNEIVMLGAACPERAPKNMLLDYQPCEKCRAHMAKGITLVEAQREPLMEDQRPMVVQGQKAYPTGNWVVVHEESVRRNFQPADLAEAVIKCRKALIDKAVFDEIIAHGRRIQ